MRALKVLVVVMGVLIVLGTAGLVTALVYRLRAPPRLAGGVPAVVPGGVVPAQAVLDEPAGTRITALAAVGGRLAVGLQGGGPDRVVVLDLASGQVAGRVSLAR